MTNCIAFVAGLIIFIRNFYTLLFGRFVQGACIGCYITMAPLIIREIAPTEIAGVLGSITQIFMTGGVAFVCVFQYVLAQVFEDKECWIIWPYVFGFPLVTLTLQTLILLFVFPYETPKYLIGIGDKAGARELIETLYK
jgi:MFS family permease